MLLTPTDLPHTHGIRPSDRPLSMNVEMVHGDGDIAPKTMSQTPNLAEVDNDDLPRTQSSRMRYPSAAAPSAKRRKIDAPARGEGGRPASSDGHDPSTSIPSARTHRTATTRKGKAQHAVNGAPRSQTLPAVTSMTTQDATPNHKASKLTVPADDPQRITSTPAQKQTVHTQSAITTQEARGEAHVQVDTKEDVRNGRKKGSERARTQSRRLLKPGNQSTSDRTRSRIGGGKSAGNTQRIFAAEDEISD